MKFSILYISVIVFFAFCIFINRKAKNNQSISKEESRSVDVLLLSFFVWTLIAIMLGIKGSHVLLMERIPLLWQACVPVAIVFIGLLLSRNLRSALSGIASGTPWHWLVFFQALRIGAIGGVMKGLSGEVTSGFVLLVGIPDFFFGVSALIVGWRLMRKVVGNSFLMIWNLIGAAIILLPTFLFMNYWMNEPGFTFIFEFPMVLAPSILVPTFVLLNILLAWGIFKLSRGQQGSNI